MIFLQYLTLWLTFKAKFSYMVTLLRWKQGKMIQVQVSETEAENYLTHNHLEKSGSYCEDTPANRHKYFGAEIVPVDDVQEEVMEDPAQDAEEEEFKPKAVARRKTNTRRKTAAKK